MIALIKEYFGFNISTGYTTIYIISKGDRVFAGYDTMQECHAFIHGYNGASLIHKIGKAWRLNGESFEVKPKPIRIPWVEDYAPATVRSNKLANISNHTS